MAILRAGCYERVSSDEQAKFGFSIQTQIDALNEHCKKNSIKIVDHYTDEGVSGGKAAFKRPEMSRLLDDVEQGKIDIILFTRLDRWFRNVPEYFKVQELLDANGVQWKAIWEDYDTTSSNGRMAITLFLAIAQNEREKGSERIKVVFDNKRKKGEAWFGRQNMPFGYTKQRDENGVSRLVKDPELKDAVQEFWDIMQKYDSVAKAGREVTLKYGLKRPASKWRAMLHNEFYIGKCRDNENFCEPYISKEYWDKLQQRGGVKASPKGRIYLFTGLIRCPACRNKMIATFNARTLVSGETCEYFYYRCRHRFAGICDNEKGVSEIVTERWLLANLEQLIENEIARVEIEKKKPKPKPKVNVKKLKEQLRRLEVVYMAGNKSDEEYISESNEIKALIKKAEAEHADTEEEHDLTYLKELLETDFRSIYQTLNSEERRRFWRSIIKEIHIEGNRPKSVDFL